VNALPRSSGGLKREILKTSAHLVQADQKCAWENCNWYMHYNPHQTTYDDWWS